MNLEYIGEQDMIDFARENSLSRKIVGHVFNKLIWNAENWQLATIPNRDETSRKIRGGSYFRKKFRVTELIDLNPNLLGSDGCIKFMITLQNHLKEAVYSEAT